MIDRQLLIAAAVFLLSPCVLGASEAVIENSWRDQGFTRIVWNDNAVDLRRGADGLSFSSQGERMLIAPLGEDGAEAGLLKGCRSRRSGVEATFQPESGGEALSLALDVSPRGILTITPSGAVVSVLLRVPVEVGVLPGLRLEDVLYPADALTESDAVHVPVHNSFAGLLRGGGGMFIGAWPDGEQGVTLHLEGSEEERTIATVEIALDGAPLYLGLLAAPAIWHRQEFSLRQYERDSEMDWKPSYEAQYRTQLPMRGETTTLRSFVFRMEREELPNPEVGNCIWPVWFDRGRPMVHVGKRIPARGEAIVYPYDWAEKSLLGFLRATPAGRGILERNKRALLPEGPRGATNVGFIACGGTHILRNTIYAWGLHSRERTYLLEHADLMADYVAIIQKKNIAYFKFIEDARRQIGEWRQAHEGEVELNAFFDVMLQHVERVEEGHIRKMELYDENTPEGHIAEADRCAARL